MKCTIGSFSTGNNDKTEPGRPIPGRKAKKMFEWYFSPDADDIKRCKGGVFPCRSGSKYKTESVAEYHGKKWMKECHRTGKIKAIPAKQRIPSYILDY